VKENKISITYRDYPSGKLPSDYIQLIESALKAAEKAYAPYSKFKVGVAARLTDGTIVLGSNQENAAYPSGLCAERVAMFYLQSEFPGQSVEIMALTAIINNEQTEEPIFPCGSCRQVLLEHEQMHMSKVKMLFAGKNRTIEVDSATELMPLFFSGDILR
jgi:cytidine deaminase